LSIVVDDQGDDQMKRKKPGGFRAGNFISWTFPSFHSTTALTAALSFVETLVVETEAAAERIKKSH
jgi:hypothetical protein